MQGLSFERPSAFINHLKQITCKQLSFDSKLSGIFLSSINLITKQVNQAKGLHCLTLPRYNSNRSHDIKIWGR